jgi:hypothetical protein
MSPFDVSLCKNALQEELCSYVDLKSRGVAGGLGCAGMISPNPWREGFEAIMFRTVNDRLTLRDSILPPEPLVLPAELSRVDGLLGCATLHASPSPAN